MGTQFADITCKESLAVYLVPNQVTRSLKCKGVIPPPRPSENSIFRHKISPFLSSCVIEN